MSPLIGQQGLIEIIGRIVGEVLHHSCVCIELRKWATIDLNPLSEQKTLRPNFARKVHLTIAATSISEPAAAVRAAESELRLVAAVPAVPVAVLATPARQEPATGPGLAE
jgi:hypothetical protein